MDGADGGAADVPTPVLTDVQPSVPGLAHAAMSATEAAQVSSDRIFMTGYRVTMDEVEPSYAVTSPSRAMEAKPRRPTMPTPIPSPPTPMRCAAPAIS